MSWNEDDQILVVAAAVIIDTFVKNRNKVGIEFAEVYFIKILSKI